jgi:hypothetical protein
VLDTRAQLGSHTWIIASPDLGDEDLMGLPVGASFDESGAGKRAEAEEHARCMDRGPDLRVACPLWPR